MDDLSLSPSAPTAVSSSDPTQKRRVALAAGLSLLWGAFTLLAQISGALDVFEEPLLDWRQSLATSATQPSDQLALVAIDNIPSDHPWPWSRLDYSMGLRALIDYNPQSVVFTMNLNDRDTQYTSFDDAFSHIVKRANTVVFSATALTGKNATTLPPKLGTLSYHGSPHLISRFDSATWPLDTFAGDSPMGINNLESEDDQRLRHLPLVFLLDDKMVPSLVLQATAQFLQADLSSSEVQIGRAIFLRNNDGRLLRTIPIDDQGRLTVRFHPGAIASWQASYDNVILYDDQMQHGLKTDQDLRDLARRQVWIGRTDPGERTRYTTAAGPLSRVEVQMQAERTILDQDYVRPLPPMILVMVYLLIGIAGATALVRLGPVHAAALLVVLAVFWLESALLAFRLYNVILPLPSFAMLLFGTYAVGLLAIYWDLETESVPEHEPLDS